MKVTVIRAFYDLKTFTDRKVGDVIEVPEDRGSKLIAMLFAKAEGVKAEKAEAPKAKTATKKAAKKTDPTASA
jgi:hypothetical protein